MPDRAFIDTNVLLYLLSADTRKAERAESVLQAGGLINVQVLNELTNITRRKFAMSWAEINEFQSLISMLCRVEPLTLDVHDSGKTVAERYQLSVFDAMIVGAALIADCKILYSEDMQDGLVINKQLKVYNPFKR